MAKVEGEGKTANVANNLLFAEWLLEHRSIPDNYPPSLMDTLFNNVITSRLFKFAFPSLLIFGPLVPAYDCFNTRALMAGIQGGIGLFFLGAARAVTKDPLLANKALRRRSTFMFYLSMSIGLIMSSTYEMATIIVPSKNFRFLHYRLAKAKADLKGEHYNAYYGPADYKRLSFSAIREITKESVVLDMVTAMEMKRLEKPMKTAFDTFKVTYIKDDLKSFEGKDKDEQLLELNQSIINIIQEGNVPKSDGSTESAPNSSK